MTRAPTLLLALPVPRGAARVARLALLAALLVAGCAEARQGASGTGPLATVRLTDVAHILGPSQLGPWSSRPCRFLPLPSRVHGVAVSGRREECYTPKISGGRWRSALGNGSATLGGRSPRQPVQGGALARHGTVNEGLIIVSVRFGSHRQATRRIGPLLRLAVAPLSSTFRVRLQNPLGTIIDLAPKPGLNILHSGLGLAVAQGRCASALVLLGLRVLNGRLERGKLGILSVAQQESLARGPACR